MAFLLPKLNTHVLQASGGAAAAGLRQGLKALLSIGTHKKLLRCVELHRRYDQLHQRHRAREDCRQVITGAAAAGVHVSVKGLEALLFSVSITMHPQEALVSQTASQELRAAAARWPEEDGLEVQHIGEPLAAAIICVVLEHTGEACSQGRRSGQRTPDDHLRGGGWGSNNPPARQAVLRPMRAHTMAMFLVY
ncbi:hypothetical protein TRIUR3_14021 [Triticum urartu]|uniref:Uncharacterized protein n=1 Tax=Triticum urartu TaxID=4572 RepID=M7YZW4_TRIUA|nr:hypothetical protein TRIUR3_14021 [Triticum urartu]